jgi:two-component system, OmpR family, sensor histidine kinase KdpD
MQRGRAALNRPSAFLSGAAVVALATVVSWFLLGPGQLVDAVMVYLLGVVVVSLRLGYGPSLLAAVLSVLAFDFFFVPPYFTLRVSDLRHVATFGVMFLVAVVISGLTKRVRDQENAAHAARLQIETEQLRSSVLSSVSHDLRTPLAVITGAASTLLEEKIEPTVRRELTDTILHESERLNRLVQNLLDMSRLEAGALRIAKQWQPIEEVVGSALGRMEKVLGIRNVVVRMADGITLVPLDSVLVEQVFVNLLENAAKYSPAGTPIELIVRASPVEVEIEVADRGPGVPQGQEERIFEKFHRGSSAPGGAGLGLAICRGIVLAHGGRIWVERRDGGGSSFRFTLPIEGDAPKLDAPEERMVQTSSIDSGGAG